MWKCAVFGVRWAEEKFNLKISAENRLSKQTPVLQIIIYSTRTEKHNKHNQMPAEANFYAHQKPEIQARRRIIDLHNYSLTFNSMFEFSDQWPEWSELMHIHVQCAICIINPTVNNWTNWKSTTVQMWLQTAKIACTWNSGILSGFSAPTPKERKRKRVNRYYDNPANFSNWIAVKLLTGCSSFNCQNRWAFEDEWEIRFYVFFFALNYIGPRCLHIQN